MSFRHHPAHRAGELVADGYLVIDIREPHELAAGALPDSTNMPLSQLRQRIGAYPRTSRIALICQTGNRSVEAADTLVRMGFTNVVNLLGGVTGAARRSVAA